MSNFPNGIVIFMKTIGLQSLNSVAFLYVSPVKIFNFFSSEFKIQATHVTLSTYGGKTLEVVGYVSLIF